MSRARNVGGIVTTKTALRPQSSTGAASFGLAGVVIDRSKYQSALLHVQTGAKTGAPTTVAVRAKLRHSATSGGTYVDVPVGPANPVVAIVDITDQNQDRWLELDFSAFEQFVRVDFEIVFTGGSSPAVLLSADIVLGGEAIKPPVHG